MSTKFDDPQYLADWVKAKKYPQIHDKMTYAAQFMQGGNLLDLCCSYGLLGARLGEMYPEKFPVVVGVDGDEKVVQASHVAGMCDGPQARLDELLYLRIEPTTILQLIALIGHFQITSVVARRAFPELFSEEMGSGHEFGRQTAQRLHEACIKEILIEGRIYSARSTNTLAKLENEVELFSDFYEAEYLPVPNVALLKAR
jgi:hypothetical protein